MRRLTTVAACCVFLLTQTGCPGVSEFLKSYGYTELRPPSTLLAPGAMVAVVSRHPLQVKIICGSRSSLGNRWRPQHSLTNSSEFKRARKKSFNLDADLLSQIKANVHYAAINSITMKFSDVKIVELTDEDVMMNIQNRSEDCRRAVAARRAAGWEVTMVSSGIFGDVTYTVSWDDSVEISAEAKIAALQNLAIELGGGSSMVGGNTIYSKGLTWGIKDDMFLADLSMPSSSRNNVKRGTMLFSPEDETEVASLVAQQPEAPVVMPAEPVPVDFVGQEAGDLPDGMTPVPDALPAQPTRPRQIGVPRAKLRPRPTTMFDSVERGKRQVFGDSPVAEEDE